MPYSLCHIPKYPRCVDVHPSEPWIVCSLYSGHVYIWNYQTSALVKTIEVCELPGLSNRDIVLAIKIADGICHVLFMYFQSAVSNLFRASSGLFVDVMYVFPTFPCFTIVLDYTFVDVMYVFPVAAIIFGRIHKFAFIIIIRLNV